MERSEIITYHATHAHIHLRELIDMQLPDLSTATTVLFIETAQLLDGLANVYAKK